MGAQPPSLKREKKKYIYIYIYIERERERERERYIFYNFIFGPPLSNGPLPLQFYIDFIVITFISAMK